MGETFYSVLGVDADADEETIRRAYRDHIKETHPDVNDEPQAARQFQRLTTARDVLVDSDERARYDRLGHRSYVHQYAESFPQEVDAQGNRTQYESGSGRPGTARRQTNRQTRNRWKTRAGGQLSESERRRKTAGRRRPRQAPHRSGGGYTNGSWQTASDIYARRQTDADRAVKTPLSERLATVRTLGPWLLIHAVLLVSALSTVGVLVVEASSSTSATIILFSSSVLVFSPLLCLSILHIAVLYYS